jgi:soluble lytic murein transglycosylase-like protein
MVKETTLRLQIALAVIAIAGAQAARATCWEEAARTYDIPVSVLKAVAQTESQLRPGATHRNQDGTHDIGLMQINSAWLPALAQYGIEESDLRNACTNLKVGAWILARNAMRLGWNWDAIGAYNVGCARLGGQECDRRRSNYAWKIHRALNAVPKVQAASDPHATHAAASEGAQSPVRNAAARPIQLVWLDPAPARAAAAEAVHAPEFAEEKQGARDED